MFADRKFDDAVAMVERMFDIYGPQNEIKAIKSIQEEITGKKVSELMTGYQGTYVTEGCVEMKDEKIADYLP